MASPRVLTITFELHVPEGLRANIRGKRLDRAIERITGAVQTLVPQVFPWADRIAVRYDWSYRWWHETDEITLPATGENTVDSPPSPEEEAALVVSE
jgi:hypothetical protein